MIDEKDVKKIAHLARLELEESQIPALSKQLSDIMDYVESLNELDLEGVEPTAHAVEVKNVFRADEAVQNKTFDDVIEQSPDRNGRYFKVPKVL